RISGRVTSNKLPLPGVAISASDSASGRKALTSTGMDGFYSFTLPPGNYALRAELAAFAPASAHATVGAASCDARADMEMTLASRLREQSARQQTQSAFAGAGPGRRGFQDLSLNADLSALNSPELPGFDGTAGASPL